MFHLIFDITTLLVSLYAVKSVKDLYKKVVFEGVGSETAPGIEQTDFAATRQFIGLCELAILHYRPRSVMEAGSGYSTGLFADLCETHSIQFISLEQDQGRVRHPQTVYAPLNGQGWYAAPEHASPDLLILDGPSGGNRFAIPFSPDLIIADDAHRERRKILRFAKERGYAIDFYNVPRGAAILRRNHPPNRATDQIFQDRAEGESVTSSP